MPTALAPPRPGQIQRPGDLWLPDRTLQLPQAGPAGPAGPIIRRILVNNTAASGASGVSTLSVNPTGQQELDWAVALVGAVGGATVISTPSPGWSEIIPQVNQSNTTTGSLWKKHCLPDEAGPYQWDASLSIRMGIIVIAYSGADPNDLIDKGQTSAEGALAQQLDHNSLQPSAPRCWHLMATVSNSAAPDDNVITFTEPGAYYEYADIASTHATNANCRLALADAELPDASATGVKSVLITGGVNRQLVGLEAILRIPTTDPTAEYVLSQYAGFY